MKLKYALTVTPALGSSEALLRRRAPGPVVGLGPSCCFVVVFDLSLSSSTPPPPPSAPPWPSSSTSSSTGGEEGDGGEGGDEGEGGEEDERGESTCVPSWYVF